MRPRLGLRPILGRGRSPKYQVGRPQLRSSDLSCASSSPSICLLCSLSRTAPTARLTRGKQPPLPITTTSTSTHIAATRRAQSTEASPLLAETATATATPTDPRKDLAQALLDLQRYAPRYVNAARLQLALRNLHERAGDESVRVAVWTLDSRVVGLEDEAHSGSEPVNGGGSSSTSSTSTTKKLLRLVLADPLVPETDWEKKLEAHDSARPLVIRVGVAQGTSAQQQQGGEGAPFTITKDGDGDSDSGNSALPEITVSSPALRGNKLEILIMGTGAASLPRPGEIDAALPVLEDAVLAPTVETTPAPVHKALLVGDGILGAASAVMLSRLLSEDRDVVAAAVNLHNSNNDSNNNADNDSGALFDRVDIARASEALGLFRTSATNAPAYESLWTDSNVAAVTAWLHAGVVIPAAGGDETTAATKPPVRRLIRSLLQNATGAIDADEAGRLSAALAGKIGTGAGRLEGALAEWAQAAHAELQEQLDAAFAGPRWRRLGWWQLFWRVDDVGGIASEMVALRFLPDAERHLIYLTGRIRGAGVLGEEADAYPGPTLASVSATALEDSTASTTTSATATTSVATTTDTPAAPSPVAPSTPLAKWPTHIPFTRHYIQEKSIPALQALAQRLVAECLGTTGLTAALAALTYVSALGGLYEAGSVAALGLVVALRRLQTRWGTARRYWEGEVREEGRKAVRAAESSVADALDHAAAATATKGNGGIAGEELLRARELVRRAEEALERLK